VIRILLGLIVLFIALVPGMPQVVSAASTTYVPFDADGQVNGTIVDPGWLAVRRLSPALANQHNPAQMSVQYLNINPKQAYPNQPVNITTNVVNTGDEAGNLIVDLKINGEVEQSCIVSVGPQGTKLLKFTVTKAQPGTYTVDIGGQTGSFIILGASSSTASTHSSGGLIAFLLMGILILFTVVVLMLTYRRPA